MRILLVEDDPWERERFSRSLTRWRLEFDLAEDGLIALERLATQTYSLILLDVMLPRLDGFQVLDRMKASPEWSTIPVILLSPKTADNSSFTYWGGDPVKSTFRKDHLDDLTPLMREARRLLGVDKDRKP